MKMIKFLSLPSLLMVVLLFSGFTFAKMAPFHKDNKDANITVTIDDFKKGDIPYSKLLKANEINARELQNNPDQVVKYKVLSFTVGIAPKKIAGQKDRSSFVENVVGYKLNDIIKEHLKNLQAGDLVVVGNVYVAMPNGDNATLSGVTYTVKAD